MKRKYSWVSLRAYKIQLGTLGLYEKQLGDYCLTARSLEKLRKGITEAGEKKPKVKNKRSPLRNGISKKGRGMKSGKKKKNVHRKVP